MLAINVRVFRKAMTIDNGETQILTIKPAR